MKTAPGILLDTTVVIDALRNRNQRRHFIDGLINTSQTFAVSAITIAEVSGGLRPGEEDMTRLLFSGIDSVDVSPKIAEDAGQMKAQFRRQGQTRSITDMIIAATALEHGFSVATDNRKDFQVPGLALYPLP